ncbi:ferrichrome ABC transporter substrate-binding protein [Staphylococcus muscae]|uniref:ABC-type cobalamin Fe3+-siderophores transport system periplasmic component n=1 Tax=Staphylococcus muscae TaxID=1294 RepID=A0A240C806_9STAP|nr:ABC transporter substrate-binding protein [Staphylococcus muscae]AVQ33675.1 ferrichrome ABC transporter substrate-binding protein [Staphylococcus muscae]PNZ02623.1 ferrichrome ABC transporter substrate-binding protein [Staphylococcus muscae]GGA86762.1 ferrichrome ABC transporter substrate-binding protein [Staphylococcus muscae]SNW03959.1 ABC-type cobalamin Fe3+-siderophores transport system periplasmic component [Staphylococcus muscae]
MKRLLFSLLAVVFVLAACGQSDNNKGSKAETQSLELKTADGSQKVDIPKDPKRIVVLSPTYAGGLKYLDANIAGVVESVDQSPVLAKQFKNVEKIGAEDVEKVATLKPDLILTYNTDKNVKKLEKIAPTLAIDYAQYNYLEQQELLGKIVGKEDQVKEWKADWEKQTTKDGKEIRKHLGEDTTVSIFEGFDKKIYAYGKNWGRGSEVVYQAFGLKMPTELEKATEKAGWTELSKEEIAKYAGDVIISAQTKEQAEPDFHQTDMWKNLPAVKNDRVIKVDSNVYWYNDPYTLDIMRKGLKEQLMNK